MEFEPVIGLEVHVQLKTDTKIFCSCSTEFGAPANAQTCPVCLGLPGVLPVLNRKVVDYALKAACATGCTVNQKNIFARKNYFYPDLPKGYQTSQFELPIAEHGHLDIQTESGLKKRIGITRIHMEEDAGKSSHDATRPVSHINLNRACTPLIEIVSEPDMRSAEEAIAYLKQLHGIVRFLGICDGNMEEGSFRCDANVSVRPKGTEPFGTRAEIKNINSFRFIEKAINHEISRQVAKIEAGEEIVQETRLWDANKNRTFSMRGKEEAHDYRYFPCPDLLPLVIDDAWLNDIRETLPELPHAMKARFMEEFGLNDQDATTLTASKALADYFETAAKKTDLPKKTANWVTGALLGLLHAKGLEIDAAPVPAEGLADVVTLVDKGTLSEKIAKTVFEEMAETGKSADAIVEEKGLKQVSDSGAIEAIVQEVLDANPEEVAAFKGGKTKLMGFFVGQVMKASKGKANPKMAGEIVSRLLG